MPTLKRYIPLVLIGWISACINVPEIESAPPDSGTTSNTQPDAGSSGDTIRPSIVHSIPLDGSTNVSTSTVLEFEFSEPMNTGSVYISISPSIPLDTPAWSANNTRLTIQPSSQLPQNTPYTLTVDGMDLAGNTLSGNRLVSFSTAGPAPDTTAPTSLGFLPENLAIGVERTAGITILFSEPMDKDSVQNSFSITSPIGFNAGVFAWNEAGTEMKFKPNSDFNHNTTVTWRISEPAKDLSGNTLQAAITGSFRTLKTQTVTIDFNQPTSGSLSKTNYSRGGSAYNLETVGDSYGNNTYRLFIGFRLDALPESTVRITQGTLKWWISGQQGAPFEKLGRLLLEPVNIGDKLDASGIDGPVNPDAVADNGFQLNVPISHIRNA